MLKRRFFQAACPGETAQFNASSLASLAETVHFVGRGPYPRLGSPSENVGLRNGRFH